MEKKYIITYSCGDEKVREFIWDAGKVVVPKEDACAFQKVFNFCDSRERLVRCAEDGSCVVEWGFIPCEHPMRYKAMEYRMNKVEGLYRREILKPIAQAIAKECTTNRELYLFLMKNAYCFAGGRDHERVELDLSYEDTEKDAIKNAFCYRDTVCFMENEIAAIPQGSDDVIKLLVEEFISISIVEIKPYTE